jgi:hypothetical protein
MKPDGSERRKIIPDPILELVTVSPDGRWVVVGQTNTADPERPYVNAYPAEGGSAVRLCGGFCQPAWSVRGDFFRIMFPAKADKTTYLVPLRRGVGLPDIPAAGLAGVEDMKKMRPVVIPQPVDSAVSPSSYAYTRQSTRRNLYRIPLQ